MSKWMLSLTESSLLTRDHHGGSVHKEPYENEEKEEKKQ